MLVWTSLLMGKLEVNAILDKSATDQTEFILFNTKSYVCENSFSIFAVARIWFRKVQSKRIRIWKVQSIFISHNFHVRKEYDLHHPKPDLATFNATTTTVYIFFFFLSIFYLLSVLSTL
jgi:hypothetical protein